MAFESMKTELALDACCIRIYGNGKWYLSWRNGRRRVICNASYLTFNWNGLLVGDFLERDLLLMNFIRFFGVVVSMLLESNVSRREEGSFVMYSYLTFNWNNRLWKVYTVESFF